MRLAAYRRIIILLLCIAAFFSMVHWFDGAINAAGPLPASKLVYIAPGTSTRALAALLQEDGVIDRPQVFRLVASIQNRITRLKAGEYAVPAHISLLDLITVLQSGKTFERRITIPEGLSSPEIVQLLGSEQALKGTVAQMPPEGSLLPDTYEFSYGDTRESIITRMESAMKKTMAALWTKRAANYPLTESEAVVLASIVEKETAVKPERARIAGVFFNRLKRGIPLQSDPTVIFALTQGAAPLGRSLSAIDLKVQSPYNTYVVQGLPPTPICNPGRAALRAALNPEKNDYLYFVANGTGGSSFSKTLQQHKRAIAAWLKVERAEKK